MPTFFVFLQPKHGFPWLSYMWRHHAFNPSWKPKYWFWDISLHIKNVYFSMLFLMHPFFFVFDEVEISLTRHLAPVKKPETGSETQKVYAIFVITGVHIVGIRRDIFDHKRCQQVVLITLSYNQKIDNEKLFHFVCSIFRS